MPTMKRRRIPKACAACRRSKLRCDERRPCSRCINTETECEYLAKPRDPMADRMEALEAQVLALSQRLDTPSSNQRFVLNGSHTVPGLACPSTSSSSGAAVNRNSSRLACFTVRQISPIDAVHRGLISEADAMSLFTIFFEGCVVAHFRVQEGLGEHIMGFPYTMIC